MIGYNLEYVVQPYQPMPLQRPTISKASAVITTISTVAGAACDNRNGEALVTSQR